MPPPITSLAAVNTPAELSDAMVVEPYLKIKLLPDCSTEKFVVVNFCAVPATKEDAVPEQFVRTPEAGVPRAGDTNVGLSAKTKAPEPVSPVTAAAKFAEEGVARNVATPEPRPVTEPKGSPVQFVKVPDAGVPSTGDVIVGDANVGEIKWFVCCETFVPSDHTDMVLPAGITTVVPPLNVMPFLAVEFEIVAV